VGWLLLLWPTLWALWIAGDGRPQPQIVLVFVLGVVTMRAAGCVINDYLDRDFDPHVARTRNRPLATGAVSPFEALVLFAFLMALSLALVLTLNRETLVLAFVGGAIAVTYPLAKRFTYLPQVYLGLAFSWGIPMAFAAQDKTVGALAWSLVLANLLWTVAYDTMYAMADRPDDLKVGIKSSAILFGRFDLAINAVLQALALITLVLVGQYLGLNSWFYAGLAGAGATAIYQNRLCTERDRTQCLKAFLNNIWFGGFVFAGIVLAYI
jgi:4-hydroxybenzoate polyprenyltransferase